MTRFFGGAEHQPFVLGTSNRKAILVHGFPGTPAEVRGVAEALVSNGWEAHGLLLPGFGPDIVTMADFGWRDWLQAVADCSVALRAEASDLLLIGYSMGGALALLSTLEAEHPPDRVVVVAPFTSLADWRGPALPLVQHVIRQLRPFERADFSDPAFRAELASMLPEADLDDEATRDRLRREVVVPTRSIEQLRQLGRAVVRRAPLVTVPTLVLQGRLDATVSFRATRKLVGRLRGRVTYHELEADHNLVQRANDGYPALLRGLFAYLD